MRKLLTAALTLVLVVLVTAACTTADKNKLNGMENEPKNAEEAVAMEHLHTVYAMLSAAVLREQQ